MIVVVSIFTSYSICEYYTYQTTALLPGNLLFWFGVAYKLLLKSYSHKTVSKDNFACSVTDFWGFCSIILGVAHIGRPQLESWMHATVSSWCSTIVFPIYLALKTNSVQPKTQLCSWIPFGSPQCYSARRKMICFRRAEINSLTWIAFITLKLDFNHGGCKWAEPNWARTTARKWIQCSQKVQEKLCIYTCSIWPMMDDQATCIATVDYGCSAHPLVKRIFSVKHIHASCI